MEPERILREAEFNPKVCDYWLVNGAFFLAITLFGIPLVPVWWIMGKKLTLRYLERMKCTLTDRSLKVKSGFFVRVEKTVPLDKITDLGLSQGPIIRHFDIEALSVETAGQSAVGSYVGLVGIVDGRAFRDAVLAQRDLVTGGLGETQRTPLSDSSPQRPLATEELLLEIRDALHRIEKHVEGKEEP